MIVSFCESFVIVASLFFIFFFKKAICISTMSDIFCLFAILAKKENEMRHVKYLRGEIDGFISNYVVEGRMVGVLRQATNEYLTQLTEGRYTIDKISSTMRRIRGGMESHGLEMTLMDRKDNMIKNKDQLSGGDETSLGLALRIAISKLMARIRPFKNSEKKPPLD